MVHVVGAGHGAHHFHTYFQVQVSVAINDWYGPFYDLIQAALGKTRPVTVTEFFTELVTFMGIAMVAVIVGVLTRFFIVALCVPLAHSDERLLHRQLGQAAQGRRCGPACAGRHHALCLHHGGSWAKV